MPLTFMHNHLVKQQINQTLDPLNTQYTRWLECLLQSFHTPCCILSTFQWIINYQKLWLLRLTTSTLFFTFILHFCTGTQCLHLPVFLVYSHALYLTFVKKLKLSLFNYAFSFTCYFFHNCSNFLFIILDLFLCHHLLLL